MKKKYLILLTAALAMSACGTQTPSSSITSSTSSSSSEEIIESSSSSSSSSEEYVPTVVDKYKVRTVNSHIADSNFKNGFEQMSQYTTDAHVEGVLDYNGERETDHYNPDSVNKTYWQHCQWWTPFDFMDATYSKVDGVHRYQNESRLMEVDTVNGSLKMALNSGIEYDYLYGGRLPADKSWAHFLIQQSFPSELRIVVADYSEVRVQMDIKIEKADYVGKTPQVGNDCAQLLFYFSISDGKNTMWFGVPIYDSRHNFVGEYHAFDSGFVGATNKLIHSIPSNTYMGDGPVEMGKTYHIDVDVKESIQEAFVRAVYEGAFTDANWATLTIGYMNFGWELPGEYDVSAVLSNLDVVTVK
jgi:hypothetical protein